MRKPALVITGVVLGLFIVAGVLWVPGYDRAGVHPELLAIEEPLQRADVSNGWEGGVTMHLVDRRGNSSDIHLQAIKQGESVTYPIFSAESSTLGKRVKHPCSVDSRRFLATLIDKYAKLGHDRHVALQSLRNAPLDALRRWWSKKTTTWEEGNYFPK